MMMKLSKNESGFTLIEILIVVLIIGIIAALAIPNLMSAQQTSWANTCFANRSTIVAAAELYRIQNNGTEAGAIGDLILGVGAFDPVMRAIPPCPAGGVYAIATDAAGVITSNCNSTKHPHL